jgi:hypothetical protein
MDLEKIIGELLDKFNLDTSLLEKFKTNPTGTVTELLKGAGLNLDPSQLKSVVEGLAAKLNLGDILGEVSGGATGILDKIKSLFGK